MDKLTKKEINQDVWDFLMSRYLAGDQDMQLGSIVSLMRVHVMELDKRIDRMEKKFKFYSKSGKDGLI
jgi:hypothetical protein